MQVSTFPDIGEALAAPCCHHTVSSAVGARETRPLEGAPHGMASEQNQLPSDDGIQGCERAGGECRDHPTEVTGR